MMEKQIARGKDGRRPGQVARETGQGVPSVRSAAAGDVAGIVRLVNEYARRGDLLPRSAESIAAGLDDWFVAEAEGEKLGCVSLLRYTSGLVEVRSLAVDDAAQGMGIGRLLMEALIEEAERREIPTLFALTRAVGFFERCGFSVVEKDLFPEKVWADCRFCPVRERCDETAVVFCNWVTDINRELKQKNNS